MCRICPECGSIAEYSDYYGTVLCTRCNWESEKVSYGESQKYSSYKKQSEKIEDCSNIITVKELLKV